MNRILIGIAFTLLVSISARSQRVEYDLVMRMDGLHELHTGEVTNIWGFGFGSSEVGNTSVNLPAPTLTATEGDSVIVRVINKSDEGHTIHWHGLDVDQANDGVPHTSDFVLTGDTFIYRFKATHAGNYTYHCHVTTTLHLMMGMYGSFIVYAQNPDHAYIGGPEFDKQYDYLGSELDKSWNDDFMSGGALNEFSPDHFLLNGLEKQQLYKDDKHVIEMEKGDRVLLRLLNIGFSIDSYTFPEGIIATVHGSDGRPLPQPFTAENLELFPGERYNVIIEQENENFSGHITVDYLDMYEKRYQGTNYIGINSYEYPVIGNVDDFGQNPRNPPVTIYPNPASNTLYVKLSSGEEHPDAIEIFDGRGTLISRYEKPAEQINIGFLSRGYYFLRISHKNNSLSIPFVKK